MSHCHGPLTFKMLPPPMLSAVQNINQKAVAYTSVLTTFTILWLIIFYHVYTYTIIFLKAKMNISRMINKFRSDATVRARCHLRRSTDGNINRFKKSILDMIAGTVSTDSYDNVPLVDDLQPTVEPTYSVVELPKPQDTDQLEPEEANIHTCQPQFILLQDKQLNFLQDFDKICRTHCDVMSLLTCSALRLTNTLPVFDFVVSSCTRSSNQSLYLVSAYTTACLIDLRPRQFC